MESSVIIPSMGEWYVEPLMKREIRILSIFDASTFNVTLNCVLKNNFPVIIKAFQFTGHQQQLEDMKDKIKSFEENTKVPFVFNNSFFHTEKFFHNDLIFLIRSKIEYTLFQRIQEDPKLEEIEKHWIVFQIINSMKIKFADNETHNCIHPDNILTDRSLNVFIADEAPFKPCYLMNNKPHIFYHFFSTATRTQCYLSPERIIENDDDCKPTIDDTDDIFSVGLVIYFIFTVDHLFTFSTLQEYKKGRYDISKQLSKLPPVIGEIVGRMLSLDLEVRKSSFDTSSFPLPFSQIHSQMHEFEMSKLKTVATIKPLLPIFELLCEANESVRIILLNFFLVILMCDNSLQDFVFFMGFILKFVKSLNSRITLGRVLPHFVTFLYSKVQIVRTTALKAITDLLHNVNEIDESLANIFSNYFIPILYELESDENETFKSVFAEEIVKIINEIKRLSSKDALSVVKILNCFIRERSHNVLNCFSSSLKELYGCSFSIYQNLLPIFISCMNSSDEDFKASIIYFLKDHYEHLSTNKDKNDVKVLLNEFIPGILGIMRKEEGSEKMLAAFLTFLNWFLREKLFNDETQYAIFSSIIGDVDAVESSPSVDFLKERIKMEFPGSSKESLLPVFLENLQNIGNRVSYFPEEARRVSVLKKFPGGSKMHVNDVIFDDVKMLKPRFIDSFRVGRNKIIGLAPFFSGNNQLISLDSKGGISTCSVERCDEMFSFPSTTVILPNWDSSAMFIGNTTGQIESIDWLTMKGTKLPFTFESSISSLEDFTSSVIIATVDNGTIALIDKRSPKIAQKVCFDDFTPSCSCIWNQSKTSLIGFKEGFVSAIDWRFNYPLFFRLVPLPPVSVCPIGGEGDFSVATNNNILLYNETDNEIKGCYNVCGVSHALSFSKGGLFIGDRVYYTNFNDKLYILKDRRVISYEENKSYQRSKEVHCHLLPITSLTRTGSSFATADSGGFVHLWNVC